MAARRMKGSAYVIALALVTGCAARGLPHRPLHEIDIQGHMPAIVYGDSCPGRYEYGAYGVTITCWGIRK